MQRGRFCVSQAEPGSSIANQLPGDTSVGGPWTTLRSKNGTCIPELYQLSKPLLEYPPKASNSNKFFKIKIRQPDVSK